MKLHEALRKIFKLFGIAVLKEKRLVFLLADYKAFDDFPAMKQVMEAIVTGRYGRELCLRAADDDSADYELYTDYLRISLVRVQRFRKEFAQYATDSISFAIGFLDSVKEPQDHGFDPYRKDSDDSDDDVSGDAEGEKTEKEKEHEVGGGSEVQPAVEPEAPAAEPDDTKPAPMNYKNMDSIFVDSISFWDSLTISLAPLSFYGNMFYWAYVNSIDSEKWKIKLNPNIRPLSFPSFGEFVDEKKKLISY